MPPLAELRRHRMKHGAVALGLAFGAVSAAHAYDLSGQYWPNSPIVMELQLGRADSPLTDGSATWDDAAENALATWSSYLKSMKFSVVRNSTAPIARRNDYNNVIWSTTVYGSDWDPDVIAVTLSRYSTNSWARYESDVLFNANLQWDSYRGGLRHTSTGATIYDFHRVALHEFGHVLGLQHPDEAGQNVFAQMNSHTSSLDGLTNDDVVGARAIYDITGVVDPGTLRLLQPLSYTVAGDRVTLADGGVRSTRITPSGLLSIELWAMPDHMTGKLPANSYRVGGLVFYNALGGGQTFNSGSLPVTYHAPPAGTYYMAMLLTEVTGYGTSAQYTICDYSELADTLVVPASAPATGTPPSPATNSALSNLSVRSIAGSGAQTFILGFAITGSGAKQVLLRGIGPTLGSFGIGGALADPQLNLFDAGGKPISQNDDWGGGTLLTNAFSAVGAFGLAANSKDAALLTSLTPGAYSAQISSTGNTGVAMIEAYDVDGAAATSHFSNLSVRSVAGAGPNLLIVGFTVSGTTTKRVLLRAVGPTLASFGLGGVLADPKMELFDSSGKSLAVNDNWGGGATLADAFQSVSAFGLPANSLDAAMVVTLPPGGYTAQVTGADGGSGVALVEVYELP